MLLQATQGRLPVPEQRSNAMKSSGSSDYPLLYQVTARHMAAGFVIEDGVIVEAAPIIHYVVGWREKQAFKYFHNRKWKVRRV